MRIKTIIILVIAILLTIIFMQNLDPVRFTVLFSTLYISKVSMMLVVLAVGFVLGYLVGRPGRKKYNHIGYDKDTPHPEDPRTLSDEDRDYIN
ncbi:LapA family protein [Mucilaginibacter terrenus]|uniref:LapA family protein n=1 Tax=Mucilaginibacter terrenus TaxID=2482727 RepID=A0A3E2NXA9_9SPHI|nr:LapA family protein [Mucilaginibacter terrenus]RFZ85551.1 LapA family protein [Mucilaginibacter terrenus]